MLMFSIMIFQFSCLFCVVSGWSKQSTYVVLITYSYTFSSSAFQQSLPSHPYGPGADYFWWSGITEDYFQYPACYAAVFLLFALHQDEN